MRRWQGCATTLSRPLSKAIGMEWLILSDGKRQAPGCCNRTCTPARTLRHLWQPRIASYFGFDASVWQPSSKLLSGNQLAQKILQRSKSSAMHFEQTYGRRPSLAVVTVGELERYAHGSRRLEIYSHSSRSWFSKTEVGNANNFDVTEINLDGAKTTTDVFLSELQTLQMDSKVVGIQVMWPLPDHIDTSKVYDAVDQSKDVDGIHFVGQQEIGNQKSYPPVTPAGALALMKEHHVELKGKQVVVIGRSPIVGSPLAHMCRQEGAAVTVVHSEVPRDTVKSLVGSADVALCCAGKPGLIPAEWFSKDAVVVNVGTTFVEEADSLVSDIEGDVGKYAARYSPVPGGVGPVSAPMLFQNVAQAAWDQMYHGETAALTNASSRHLERLQKTCSKIAK